MQLCVCIVYTLLYGFDLYKSCQVLQITKNFDMELISGRERSHSIQSTCKSGIDFVTREFMGLLNTNMTPGYVLRKLRLKTIPDNESKRVQKLHVVF